MMGCQTWAEDETSDALCRVDRRNAISVGGLGAMGLFWSDWLRAANVERSGPRQKAKSVILIFNAGAPSHIDLWDPKPHATDDIRGPYQPIATSVPGIQVSQLLPRLAKHADKLAILRTLHHTHGGHNSGMYWSIVGRPYAIDSTLINPSRTDYPSFGTLVGWLTRRDGYRGALPPYVITPKPHCDSLVYITPGQYGACLGPRYDPLVLNADPNAENFHVPNLSLVDGVTSDRLLQRGSLLEGFNARGPRIESPLAHDYRVNQENALSLVTSPEVSKAFDLSQEPTAIRDRYGRHAWGQSHLLARRLIEAGTRFVTTVNGPSIVWDTHADNFNRLEKTLVPPMEQGFAALIEDLSERGLLDSTLVIWMSDFGRTPIINKGAGRDHWPQCYTMVLAGGGIRGGQIVGESDKIGAIPRNRPLTPADVHATVFVALGYDPRQISYHTADGRPTPLTEGTPIGELL